MHEFGLMADLLRKIEQLAGEQGATRITRVDIWLGALAHISAVHFREHFTEGSTGTVAEGAELNIEVSDDIGHPQAQEILLRSVEVG